MCLEEKENTDLVDIRSLNCFTSRQILACKLNYYTKPVHTYSEDWEKKSQTPKQASNPTGMFQPWKIYSTSDNQNSRPDYLSDYELGSWHWKISSAFFNIL